MSHDSHPNDLIAAVIFPDNPIDLEPRTSPVATAVVDLSVQLASVVQHVIPMVRTASRTQQLPGYE